MLALDQPKLWSPAQLTLTTSLRETPQGQDLHRTSSMRLAASAAPPLLQRSRTVFCPAEEHSRHWTLLSARRTGTYDAIHL